MQQPGVEPAVSFRDFGNPQGCNVYCHMTCHDVDYIWCLCGRGDTSSLPHWFLDHMRLSSQGMDGQFKFHLEVRSLYLDVLASGCMRP
jgi:hypothetical protein